MKFVKFVGTIAIAFIVIRIVMQAEGGTPKSVPPDASLPTASSPAAPASTTPLPGQPDMPAWANSQLPSETVRQAGSLAVVTNPDSMYVLVNKKRNLPSVYEPADLVVPNVAFSFSGNDPKKQMRKDAAAALEKLFAGAAEDDVELKAVSGYRSYDRQRSIFNLNAKRQGEEAANRTSARPGQSEHQTGLAVDISSASVGYGLETSFGETKEGRWLAAHASEYGFIIRYPKGKQDITGYTYEPWHVRYVGVKAANDIATSKLTLEQYYEKLEASR